MTNKDYVAPTIARHQSGQMNAHAHGQSAAVCASIDGVGVSKLFAEHGSPLFVFSEATMRRAYREAHAAFQCRYPDVQFAWSYKTNYLKAVCAVFHQEGAIAEVVSDFEYDKARAMGIPSRDIIFNGPYKQPAALERAVVEGAKIQIDNLDELQALSAIAEKHKRGVDVAVRVYMDSGARPVWSKFGFNADTTEAVEAIKRIHGSRRLRLTGLHTHVGTYILDPHVYTCATEKLIELAEAARREFGFDIAYLNLGGGFASRSYLDDPNLHAVSTVPPIDAYAEAICKPILDRWPKGCKLPKLYLETGRALVDEAGYLLTTIVAVKQGPGLAPPSPETSSHAARDKSGHRTASSPGAAGYLVDSGVHLLYMAAWYQFDIRPARPVAGPLTERTLFGCLCMNIDVIRQSVPLPDMNVGDQLVLHPVGAYNVTQSMQFIAYRPRIVMVTEQGGVEIIRERENLQHVEALERLPDRLRQVTEHVERPALN